LREHQSNFPDEDLHRPSNYSLASFREEIVRDLCGFSKYDVPPVYSNVKPPAPPGQFDTTQMTVYSLMM